MVHKILFWSGFGLGVRFWQLGLEMRPLFTRETLWAYPVFAGVGGAFGYWLQGVEERQFRVLTDRRDILLEKRRRRAEREREGGAVKASEGALGTERQSLEESVLPTSTAVVPPGQPIDP
ncbi:MAG: hypothetical protein M1821_000083 [Bathelium mastoideum]|nr:MAG: hypothetical protein M1821_000083 [Bathelium mastoideum]